MDGTDIVSRVPVSDSLLFQLNTFVVPVLAKLYGARKITIDAPHIADNTETAGAVGAGLTCGVDSLYTVAEYSKTPFPRQNLTHLCLFNVGSHDIAEDNAAEIEKFRIGLAERFCAENGYTFLRVNSNLHDFAPRYQQYFSVLNAATAMALPRLFSSYYSSSGFAADAFHMTATDLAHAEIFFLAMLSAGTLKFLSTGSEISRLEKTRRLAAFPPAYNFLNVCNLHAHNCSRCIKCLRTLYALDILDALDRFAAVFDIADYRKNHARYVAECWVRKVFAKDIFCKHMWPMLRKKYGLSWLHAARESVRFIRSRLKIYSFSYIRYRLRDAKH